MSQKLRNCLSVMVLLLILCSGCEDDRVAEVAREAADRQAAQNETMAGLTRRAAENYEADRHRPQPRR